MVYVPQTNLPARGWRKVINYVHLYTYMYMSLSMSMFLVNMINVTVLKLTAHVQQLK